MLTPEITYVALLITQAAHLFHHRIVKRHISYAEVISALVLCVPPFLVSLPGWAFMITHVTLILVQIVGSIWIKKLSPEWSK